MIWFYSDDPVRDAERWDAWLESTRGKWYEDEKEYDEYSNDDDFDEEE